MAKNTSVEFGFTLPNGTRIVHGQGGGALVKDAFPPDLNIPLTMYVFNAGNKSDLKTPTFSGAYGCVPFDTNSNPPRHVHLAVPPAAPDSAPLSGQNHHFVIERIFVPYGVGLVELAGQYYVIPPLTLVTIAPGVPHTWTACPAGLDITKALGDGVVGADCDSVVSDGKFLAVYEYEVPTAFFPTAQTEALVNPADYVRCEDLQSIRMPKMEISEVLRKAWFVWGMGLHRAKGYEE